MNLAAAQAIVDLMHGKKPTHVVNGDVFQSPALRAQVSGSSKTPLLFRREKQVPENYRKRIDNRSQDQHDDQEVKPLTCQLRKFREI